MTSSYHGNFWILIEKAICIVEPWKKSIGYRFAPECNYGWIRAIVKAFPTIIARVFNAEFLE